MSKSDPVKVTVEIIDKFSKDLAKLESELEKIDGKKLSVSLDIDDGGDIEKVKTLLETLEENLETTLDIDVRGEKKALALKEALKKNTQSVHKIVTQGGGVPAASSNSKDGPPSHRPVLSKGNILAANSISDIIDNHLKRISFDGDPSWQSDISINKMGHIFGSDGKPVQMKTPDVEFMQNINRKASIPSGGPRVPFGPMQDRPGMTRPQLEKSLASSRRRNMVGNLFRNSRARIGGGLQRFHSGGKGFEAFDVGGMSTSVGKIGKKLSSLKPRMSSVYNFIAALIPVLISLAGAALGVVAAFAALAVAGAGIVGIGLLGYGDSVEESLRNVKRRLGGLKEEIFGILRPVSSAFQPILDGFMGGVPGQIQKLVDPLMRLEEFESFLSRSGSGIVDWVGRGLIAMSDLSDMLEQIGLRFGRILGDILIGLLVWATKELYENQEAFIKLGGILGDIISVIWSLSKAISFVLTIFGPLFHIVARVAKLFENKYVIAILSVITFLFSLQAALVVVMGAFTKLAWLATTSIAGWVGMSLVYIGQFILKLYGLVAAANTAYGALARLAALTGIGLVAVAGSYAVGKAAMSGMSGPSGGGSYGGGGSSYGGMSGGGGVNIVVQGDMSNRAYQRVKDDFPTWYGEESSLRSATQK